MTAQISVAMATYNGESYINEQLKSLAKQARLPNELVICDDGSSDATVNIARSFASLAPFKVRIEVNPENLGYAQNFARAMSLCTGDFILLCDQDDVWLPSKIEAQIRVLEENPEALLAICDMVLCDEHLVPSAHTLLGNILSAGGKMEDFRTGCGMAFRRAVLDIVLPIPDRLMGHDNWTGRVINSISAGMTIRQPLQYYRRHKNNTSDWLVSRPQGANRLKAIRAAGLTSAVDGWRDERERCRLTRERLIARAEALSRIGMEGRLDVALADLDRRMINIDHRIATVSRPRAIRPPFILALLASGGYRQFAGWFSAFKDLIRP